MVGGGWLNKSCKRKLGELKTADKEKAQLEKFQNHHDTPQIGIVINCNFCLNYSGAETEADTRLFKLSIYIPGITAPIHVINLRRVMA